MMMATKMCNDTDGALVSTFLSSGLDLAKEKLRSSWWTQTRQYRNSSGRLGMGHPRERESEPYLQLKFHGSAQLGRGDAQFQLTMASEQNYNSDEGRYICQHMKI